MIFFICIFSSFLVYNHDFIIYNDLARIAASNTGSDDITH